MGIIFLALGVIYIVRLGTISPQRPEHFPALPPGVFAQWKALEFHSIYFYFGATFGVGFLWIPVMMAVSTDSPHLPIYFMIGFFAAFLGLLIASAVMGTKAASIKKKHKAQWITAPPPGYGQQVMYVPVPPTSASVTSPPSTFAATGGTATAVAEAPVEAGPGIAWQCRCGSLNTGEDAFCPKCKRSAKAIL